MPRRRIGVDNTLGSEVWCRSSAHIRRDLKGASGQSHSLMKNSRCVTSDVVKRPHHPKEVRGKTREVLFSRSFQEWRSRFSPSSYDRSVRGPQGRADCIGDVRQQCTCKGYLVSTQASLIADSLVFGSYARPGLAPWLFPPLCSHWNTAVLARKITSQNFQSARGPEFTAVGLSATQK